MTSSTEVLADANTADDDVVDVFLLRRLRQEIQQLKEMAARKEPITRIPPRSTTLGTTLSEELKPSLLSVIVSSKRLVGMDFSPIRIRLRQPRTFVLGQLFARKRAPIPIKEMLVRVFYMPCFVMCASVLGIFWWLGDDCYGPR